MNKLFVHTWLSNSSRPIVDKTVVAIIFLVGIFIGVTDRVYGATCINLNSDIGVGTADGFSGGPVYQLQSYLRDSSFLAATPTGYFGPATVSAVKAFQLTNNISSTGYVGPMTRALLSKKTCVSSVQGATPASTPTIKVPVTASVPSIPTGSVTSPTTGQVLSIGSSTVIRWDKAPAGNYNITLEQPGGMGVGFIAQDQSSGTNGNQYLWKVGKILTPSANSYQTLSAGTYRIRLQGTNAGSSPADLTSGWFTVVASQLSVSRIMPASAFADDATSVVLLGSGFTPSASVYFDANNSSLRATNQYISSDGTVLVFTVPANVPTGPHTIYVNDGQNSQPVTLSFTVSVSQ